MVRAGNALAMLVGAAFAATASAASVPDVGRAFAPPPPGAAMYGVMAPSEDPARQQHFLTAPDGTRLYVETWLPAPSDGSVPPSRVPTIAVISPYHLKGIPRPDRLNGAPRWLSLFVSRGYALAAIHLRGTGESTGCWGSHDLVDAHDMSRVLEWIGGEAPWSDGTIGLFGKSHDAGAQMNVAGRGDPRRLRFVKAMVPVSPVTSYADLILFDGVPMPLVDTVDTDASLSGRSIELTQADWFDGGQKDPAILAQRLPCRVAQHEVALGVEGNMTPWLLERELARAAQNITVPTLMTMGLQEIQTRQLVGAFDPIPAPKAALLGQWGHDFPDDNTHDPTWSRTDWEATVLAWFDHWLRGAHNGVRRWPITQVQGGDGQWRAEPGFPATGGPRGRLLLSQTEPQIGSTAPSGSLSYDEDARSSLTLSSGPLSGRLQISGQPFLDLWLELDKPDAHVIATLHALGPDGSDLPGSPRIGARSMRHLDPYVGGRFAQTESKDPPTGVFHARLRFEPSDLVVPAGGQLRVTIAGTGRTWPGLAPFDQFLPSGSLTHVTVHFGCATPTALRFRMPDPAPDLLDVQETDQTAPLGQDPGRRRVGSDGGGLATNRACGPLN